MGKWTENPEPVPPGEGEPLGELETGGTYTHVHAALRHGGFCSGSNKNCRAAETRGLGRHPFVELADAWAWCHRRGGDGRKAVPPRPLLEVGRDRPTVPGESPERGGGKRGERKKRTKETEGNESEPKVQTRVAVPLCGRLPPRRIVVL